MTKKKKISKNRNNKKLTTADVREKHFKAKQEAASFRKKIFTIIVCIILVAGLSIPTLALTVCQFVH